MTFSGYSFCGFAAGGLTQPVLQSALLLDRQYLIQKLQVYNPSSPFFPIPTAVRPTVVPWMLATDTWGVAYPAGIYGVVDNVAQLSPATLDFAAEWNEFWVQMLRDASNHVVAVPQSLPVGYTARLKRDWGKGRPTGALAASYTSGVISSGGYRVRTADGYNLYRWTPDPRIWGFDGTQISTNVSPSIGSKYFQVYNVGPGNRKVQFQIAYVDRAGIPWTGAMDLKLSHNAAGAIGSTTSEGSTSDFSASYSYADFSGSGIGTRYETAWIDAGAINATMQNTLTEFQSSLDLSAVVGMVSFGVVVSWRLSPRCDIPLPFTTTSKGDVIAPGGIVAGAIPGY